MRGVATFSRNRAPNPVLLTFPSFFFAHRKEFLLELDVDASTDDVVGAAEGLLAVAGGFGVVAVDRNEVADVEAYLLIHIVGTAKAYRVAVAGK